MKPKHPLTLLRRRIKEDLCAAFPYVQFVVSKSEKERTITIHWCGDDPSEAEVEATARRHDRDGIQYRLYRFEPCALCGSKQFVQGNDETMKMDYHNDPICMSCDPDYTGFWDKEGGGEEAARKKAEQRKLELGQVVKDLHDAFQNIRFTLKAPRNPGSKVMIEASRFGSWDAVYIEWTDGPSEAAVKAVINERGGYYLYLDRSVSRSVENMSELPEAGGQV